MELRKIARGALRLRALDLPLAQDLQQTPTLGKVLRRAAKPPVLFPVERKTKRVTLVKLRRRKVRL